MTGTDPRPANAARPPEFGIGGRKIETWEDFLRWLNEWGNHPHGRSERASGYDQAVRDVFRVLEHLGFSFGQDEPPGAPQ